LREEPRFVSCPLVISEFSEMSEEALSKAGPELFKELLRLYETAEVEDYYKAGQWKNELMKTDLVLLEAHRKEAGAPDPPELEDVVMPDMSCLSTPGFGGQVGIGPQHVPMMVQPQGITGVLPGAGGAVAELRLIALFVSKWKLEPTKTKMILAKITPTRRRYVISNFQTASTGEVAVAELEKFIQECTANGKWDIPTVLAGGVRPHVPALIQSPRPMIVAPMGIKRPMIVQPMMAGQPMAQRPRVLMPVNQTPQSALAARLAAVRASSPGGYGPGMVRPGMVQPMRQMIRPVAPATRPPAGLLIRNLLQQPQPGW